MRGKILIVAPLLLLIVLLGVALLYERTDLRRVCDAVDNQNHMEVLQSRGLIDSINVDDQTAILPIFKPIFDAGCPHR
jgi:hypothetical protein